MRSEQTTELEVVRYTRYEGPQHGPSSSQRRMASYAPTRRFAPAHPDEQRGVQR